MWFCVRSNDAQKQLARTSLRWMVPVFRTREVWWRPRTCSRDLKYRKSKTNMAAQILHTRWFFSCLSEIASKRKLSFGLQLLGNSVYVRKTLFVTQCPKFKAKVSISVATNPVGDRDQYYVTLWKLQVFTIRTDPKPANNMFIFSCSKLVLQPITNGFIYSTLSLNWVARRVLTICKKIFTTNE